MATPLILGVGAVAAALAGRQLFRSGVLRIGGKAAQDQWAKGGFRSKMDRREAISILGLKYVIPFAANCCGLIPSPLLETALLCETKSRMHIAKL